MTADFDLFTWGQARGQGRAPVVASGEIDLFIAALGGHRWRTAAQLTTAIGLSDRKLRALAADSQGRIISGQRGYCLISEATPEEIAHAADWLIAQGRLMIKRGIQIRKHAHHLIR